MPDRRLTDLEDTLAHLVGQVCSALEVARQLRDEAEGKPSPPRPRRSRRERSAGRLTTAQVARALDWDVEDARALVRLGKLPSEKESGRIWVRPEALIEYELGRHAKKFSAEVYRILDEAG